MIDAHCHAAKYPDPANYFEQKRAMGVTHFCVASANIEEWRIIADLSKIRRDFTGGLGIHPWNLEKLEADQIQSALLALDDLLRSTPNIRFIGECGLDATKPDMSRQIRVFSAQIEIARQHHLPLVVHCTKAFHLMPRLLKDYDDILFHGFIGSIDIQRDIVSRGGQVSLGHRALRSTAKPILPELLSRAMSESDDDNTRAFFDLECISAKYPELTPQLSDKNAINFYHLQT